MVESLTFDVAIDFMGRVALIAWNNWKARNNFVFRQSLVTEFFTEKFENSKILWLIAATVAIRAACELILSLGLKEVEVESDKGYLS
ncbi:hypothetical protein RHMOL_Rhmol13G0183100 [Rhododendron molle]|uniref:Uncharacterized protein n=1 Tax=Rhododendron molle TaxID=49168 RepID=A0ACC0L9F6_RHOML|nr:hypothetical protein RHMOL_Rhmol13G0183100 [Rhododendron molle]